MNANSVKRVVIIFCVLFVSLNLMGLMDTSQNDLIVESTENTVFENNTSDSITSDIFSIIVGLIVIVLILLFKTRKSLEV